MRILRTIEDLRRLLDRGGVTAEDRVHIPFDHVLPLPPEERRELGRRIVAAGAQLCIELEGPARIRVGSARDRGWPGAGGRSSACARDGSLLLTDSALAAAARVPPDGRE